MVLQVNLDRERLHQRAISGQIAANAERQGSNIPIEKALPYFLLSSAFILLILVLPRLQELSISDKSLVLKLVNEVKEDVDQLHEDVPLAQEKFNAVGVNDRIIRIKEKTALIEQLLKKGK